MTSPEPAPPYESTPNPVGSEPSSDVSQPSPATVWRDQCRGSDLCCMSCGQPLGGRHDVLCYAYAIARKEAQR